MKRSIFFKKNLFLKICETFKKDNAKVDLSIAAKFKRIDQTFQNVKNIFGPLNDQTISRHCCNKR
jgi:hypothetical protein